MKDVEEEQEDYGEQGLDVQKGIDDGDLVLLRPPQRKKFPEGIRCQTDIQTVRY